MSTHWRYIYHVNKKCFQNKQKHSIMDKIFK
jgi:hypothetical protein